MTGATSTPASSGATKFTVWGLAGLTFVLVGYIVWSDLDKGELSDIGLPELAAMVALLAFVVSGAVIASRQPGNVIGWLLIVPGLSAALAEVINSWLFSIEPAPVSASPAVWLGLWFTGWAWLLLIFPIFHLLLVFPDGGLLSRRWRWVVGLEMVMFGSFMAFVTFSEELTLINEDDVAVFSIENPIGLIPESYWEVFGGIWGVGLVAMTVVGVVAFILRFRSATSLQRQQLKWPLYAVAVFGIAYGVTAAMAGVEQGSFWDTLFNLSLAGIPISVAIAVLRYRLYDLDRIVSRTVTYAVVAALLVATYGLIVLTLGSFLGRDNPVAVAGATLGAAALFTPLRTRIRRWVDRRFNRSRYDAEQVIEGFVASMRGRVDPEGLVDGWIGVATETMQPVSVGAWVRT